MMLITGVIAAVLLVLNVKYRWSPTSGARALTGMAGVLASFVVIGTLLEGAVHNAAWLRDDPVALWFGIYAAFGAFVFGALGAIPWLIAQALFLHSEPAAGHDSHEVPASADADAWSRTTAGMPIRNAAPRMR